MESLLSKNTIKSAIKEKLNAEQYYWFWKANNDPYNFTEESQWAPYDLAINSLIEENYSKGVFFFEIEISDDTYCIDLNKNLQTLKKDAYRSRFIKRANRKDNILVIRKNRFANEIESSQYQNNSIKSYNEKSNFQRKIKVLDLFRNYEMNAGYMFLNENNLFNTEIFISDKIYNKLKDKLWIYIKLNNLNDVINYIKKEIRTEAERQIEFDKNNTKVNSNYLNQAEYYIKYLDETSNLSFEEKLINLYTQEGFLIYSINSMLRSQFAFKSELVLYFTLLQSSLNIVSKKFNHKLLSKSKLIINGQEYYVFYRGAQISKTFLLEDKELVNKNRGRFIVYDEFLSTTYDEKISDNFVFKDDLKPGNVRVKYRFLVKKIIADRIPNLFCFIQEISKFPTEKEVLLCSSTIFQIKNVEIKNDYYLVTSLFISNGFNKYDFLPNLHIITKHLSNW